MNWNAFPWGTALTAVLAFAGIFALALDERNRRKFAAREDVYGPDGKSLRPSREEVQGMVERLEVRIRENHGAAERVGGLFVALDDRVGDLEGKMIQVEERQTHQWARTAEQMTDTAKTLDDVTRRLEKISERQQEFALQLERMHWQTPKNNGGGS